MRARRDEHGSFSCQHFEVASETAPRVIDFRMWSRAPVSVAHFSSGMGGTSRSRSKVFRGSTGRVMVFGSSKETSAILSDSSWDVCRRQKRSFGRWMDATRDGRYRLYGILCEGHVVFGDVSTAIVQQQAANMASEL